MPIPRSPYAICLSRRNLRASMRIFLFSTCALLAGHAGSSVAGPLTGNYKIVETVAHGRQIQITLKLNFVNAGTGDLKVTNVGVYSRTKPGAPMFVPATVVVESHSTAAATVSFFMPMADFAAWSRGPHQLFAIKSESASGKLSLENIPLMRTKE